MIVVKRATVSGTDLVGTEHQYWGLHTLQGKVQLIVIALAIQGHSQKGVSGLINLDTRVPPYTIHQRVVSTLLAFAPTSFHTSVLIITNVYQPTSML